MTELPAPPVPPRAAVEERLHPLTPVVRLWLGVVAFAWFAFTSALQGDSLLDDLGDITTRLPWWFYLLGVGLLVSLGAGYWSWWTTRFVIDDTELRIENTGAFQESKRIAFSRIQGVDVTQPFAARLLGLAELSIDVGADDSTKLSFLTRRRATELRNYLMVRAHGRTASVPGGGPDAGAGGHPDGGASAWDDLSRGDEILIRLTPGDIALGAFASLEVLGILVAFGIPLAIATAFDVAWLAIGGGLVPLALALLGFLSNRLFGQFNYTLARTPAGLRITRGLFTLKSQTIPTHRVQAIQISQPLPWRWLNRARLDVSILGGAALGSGEEDGLTRTVLLPIGRPSQVQTALAAVWPGLRLEALRFHGPPARARWLDPGAHRWLGYAQDAHVIATRGGWLNRSQSIVPHARLQSLAVHQGPLERRLRVANVHLHTTQLSGLDVVTHIDEAEARSLAFAEMDAARVARTDELLDPPGLRRSLVGSADAAADADVWTLPTHRVATLLP